MSTVDYDAIEKAANAANNGKRWVAVAKSVREEDANTLGGAPTAHEGGICNVLGFNGLTGTEWRDLKRTMDDRAKARAAHIAACDPSTVLAIVDENRRLREALTAMVSSYKGKDGYCACFDILGDGLGCRGHLSGCPVPAAEAALRTGGEARDKGGDASTATKAEWSIPAMSRPMRTPPPGECDCLHRGYSGSGHMPGCPAKGAPG